jgi:hypothetical protein
MIIIVCYYIFIFKYIIIEDYSEPKSNKVPNIWYKFIIDDFFNKFTIKSKTIDQKYFTFKNMQSCIKPLMIEHNQNILNKSILCNIRSDNINSLIS